MANSIKEYFATTDPLFDGEAAATLPKKSMLGQFLTRGVLLLGKTFAKLNL
jgi:hypothetical protein